MESTGGDNHIPVHDLTSMYLSAEPSSPVKRAGHRSHTTDCGNSVLKSPTRNNDSWHAIRKIGIDVSANKNDNKNDNDDDGESDSDDSDSDDSDNEDDEEEVEENTINNDDDDGIVNLRLAIIDSYGDKGSYEGGVLQSSLKDLANGDPIPSSHGTMHYADGRVYKGQWKDGQWNGRGKTTYPNGDNYEGEYEGDQRHGIGVYKWNDGRVFQGNFRDDQRNGHGVYRWLDGSTYVGRFQEGQRHGKGTYSVSFIAIFPPVFASCDK